jgi:hypothetical protein
VQLPWPDLGKAAANSPGGGAKDAALLVAIERYPFLEDKPVTGAKRNLKDWQLYLTKTRGVPVENVILLRDDQATREKILNAAADVAKLVQPGGTLWFLFIGHGAPSAGKKAGGVLLGVDTQNDADSLCARGVAQSELLSALGKGKHARTVAILDSCFSGRSSSGSTLVAGLQPIIATRIDAVVATGAVLLAAAQGNEYAGPLPGGNRPAFSYLMLAALRGWGDSNGDGKVTVSEAAQYARRTLQALLVGRHQTPDVAGPGDSVTVASAGESGPDLAEWQRMMDGPAEAPAPVSLMSEGRTKDLAPVRREAPYANGLPRSGQSTTGSSEAGCDAEHAEDCDHLARKYYKGDGVAKNYVRAADLSTIACDAGYGAGCHTLGQLFEDGAGVTKDMARAAALYGRACDGGDIQGCAALGICYEYGSGVPRDLARAAALFKGLGQAFHFGHGVIPDKARATYGYMKACEDGDRWSCTEVGSRCAKGEGVKKDLALAAKYYQEGCKMGDEAACGLLDQLR